MTVNKTQFLISTINKRYIHVRIQTVYYTTFYLFINKVIQTIHININIFDEYEIVLKFENNKI